MPSSRISPSSKRTPLVAQLRCARFVYFLFSLIVLPITGSAAAQSGGQSAASTPGNNIDDRARKLFEAGRDAYDIGDYSKALEHFQQAYELIDRPQLLFNIAQCADRLRLEETALSAYKRYIERVPNAANRYQVEERIGVLEDVIGTKIAAPADDSAGKSGLDESLKTDPNPYADSEPSIWSRWWLWAAAGGVVAITVVAIAVASSGDETVSGDRVNGSDGHVIATLSWGGP